MLVDLESNGAQRPTAGGVRNCCREPNGRMDITGGTKPSQIVDALRRCFDINVDSRVGDYETAWRMGARTDTAISMCINYAVVSGTRFDGSPGFTGTHQVVLHAGLVWDPLYDGRRPGIPKGPQKWPKDLLRRAAGKYANIGVGRAVYLVGRTPPAKPSNYSVRFAPGAVYAYGKDGVSRARLEFSKTTSAPCTAPFTVAWGPGRKRLVEITKGGFSGKRFEPGATHVTLVERK
jgi:hypothetical protein